MSEYATARNNLVSRLLLTITERWPLLFPQIAAYVVGSASRENALSPRDLDLLFVDLAAPQPSHEANFRYLVECLQHGDPFAGAFDAADPTFHSAIAEAIAAATESVPSIRTGVSFAFGPARGELAIADNALHVHVSGPLTLGDLAPLAAILPFHGVAFRRYHRTLVGPPLTSLIPAVSPSLMDLIFWDELAIRRMRSSSNDAARRKAVSRMLTNRRDVLSYASQFARLMDHCEAALPSADAEDMEALVVELASSAASALESSLPHQPS